MKKLSLFLSIVFCTLQLPFVGNCFAQKYTVVLALSTDTVYNKQSCDFNKLISLQLEKKGYNTLWGADCREMSNQPRASLIKFQKDNHLPVGRLDEATLNALGIESHRGIEINDSWASPQLEKALRQFQRDNGLLEGFLDDKTLKALGIEEWGK